MPEHLKVFHAPVLAADGGVADGGLAVGAETVEHHGVCDSWHPAPRPLVARIDVAGAVEPDGEDDRGAFHGQVGNVAAEGLDVPRRARGF